MKIERCRIRSCEHLRTAARLTACAAIAATGSTAAVVTTSLASRLTVAGADTLWDQGTTYAYSTVETVHFQYQTFTGGVGYTVSTADTWQADDAVHFQNYKFKTATTDIWIHYDLVNQDYWSGTTGTEDTGNSDDLFGVTGTADNATRADFIWGGGQYSSGCGTYFGGERWATVGHNRRQTPCAETQWSGTGHHYLDPQVNLSNGVKSTNGGAWDGGIVALGVHTMTGLH